MGILLLLIIIINVFFAYKLQGDKIFSPWIIMMASYLPIVFMASINLDNWGQTIHLYTVLVVFVAFLCWGMGDLGAKALLGKCSSKPLTGISYYTLPKWLCVLGVIVEIGVCIAFYAYIRTLAGFAGYSGGGQILRYARYAELYMDETIGMPLVVNLGRSFCKALAYIALYCLICNLLFFKNTKNALYYIAIQLPYMVVMILSTGRIEMMYYVCYILVLFMIIVSMKSEWRKLANKRIIKRIVQAFILVLIAFWVMGYLTGKSSNNSLYNTMSVYLGTPIVNLDIYLQNPSKPEFFGQETLSGIAKILNGFGADLQVMPYYQLYKQNYANVNSNLYTSLRRYYHDYGFMGMCIIETTLGFVYSYWLEKIKKRNRLGPAVILYAWFFYPIIESAIEERVFNTIFIARTIYDMFFFMIIFSFLLHKAQLPVEADIATRHRIKFVFRRTA